MNTDAASEYFINLNYVCNERCIFCAADVTNHMIRVEGHNPWVTLEEIRTWVGESPPGPRDRVLLAGGEPTLHRELLPIVRFLSANCRDVTIFTNGVRLANPAFARSAVEAGIHRFEIALFGATAAAHEAITRLPGSFERTLEALRVLDTLRRECDFAVELRLLVSRQSSCGNPDVVRMLGERAARVDAISLNRLILSSTARETDACISWEEARPAINETARLVREAGFDLLFEAIPLCVFEGENAAFVKEQVGRSRARIAAGLEPASWRMRYFDPFLAAGRIPQGSSLAPVALPLPCMRCEYLNSCGRVEDWYVRRYGHAGLRTIPREQQPRLETTPAATAAER